MTTCIVFAALSVLSVSILKLLQCTTLQKGVEKLDLLTFYSLTASVLLLFCLDPSEIYSLNFSTALLVLLSGGIWTLSCYLRFKAYQHISASEAEIINSVTLILVVGTGAVLFSEALHLSAVLGVILIITAIFIQNIKTPFHSNRGSLYMLAATFAAAAGILLCKYLTSQVSSSLIAFAGFFIPGLIYLYCSRKTISQIIRLPFNTESIIWLIPLLAVAEYFFLLQALSYGKVTTATIIFHSSAAVILIFEVFVARITSLTLRALSSTACCLIGTSLVCLIG